jgi:hypothetical protein
MGAGAPERRVGKECTMAGPEQELENEDTPAAKPA